MIPATLALRAELDAWRPAPALVDLSGKSLGTILVTDAGEPLQGGKSRGVSGGESWRHGGRGQRKGAVVVPIANMSRPWGHRLIRSILVVVADHLTVDHCEFTIPNDTSWQFLHGITSIRPAPL